MKCQSWRSPSDAPTQFLYCIDEETEAQHWTWRLNLGGHSPHSSTKDPSWTQKAGPTNSEPSKGQVSTATPSNVRATIVSGW